MGPTEHEGHGDAGTRRWVLPATILGSSLGFIDGSVVNVALPTIQHDLRVDLATVQWVVNGYMLTLASLILLGGSAGDRHGRRRVFLLGLASFIVASLACALAPSTAWLIAARLAQGAAAALLMPASLAIIGAAYTGERRGAAIGTWAAAGAITTALGPPLGGWMVDALGWRAIFFINPPIAMLAMLFAMKLPADRSPARADPLDAPGALLAVAGLGLLSYGLIELGNGRAAAGTAAALAAVPVAWWFVRRESHTAAPMMPPDLFRQPTFAGANALTVLLYAALGGALFVLPFALIRDHGFSAAAAGAAFLPFSVIMGLGSRPAGRLVEKLGPRRLLIAGPALAAAGYAVLALSGGGSYWTGFLPGLIVVAAGMTVSVAPLTTAVFDAAPEARSGTASGINNAAARTGSLLAIAALGLAFSGPGAQAGNVAHGYRTVMAAAAVLAALSSLTAAITIRNRAGDDDEGKPPGTSSIR